MDPELDRLFEVVSGYFGLLAEPTRLKILNAICDDERSVSEIVERVESTQTNVSRHLNMMYGKGVLKRRREGADVLLDRRSATWSRCAVRRACRWRASMTRNRCRTGR